MELHHPVAALNDLPPITLERLRTIAGAAGGRAWLVGGPVRDLLLGRPVTDLDVVVEADAVALAARLPAEILKSTAFLTATVRWPDGETWDLATARTETYRAPGALPVARPTELAHDLLRRDFTINGLALSLSPEEWGAVTDVAGGVLDLRFKQIRVIHPNSFRDDPTRLFRAVRYAARLGFRMERVTRSLLDRALRSRLVDKLTPDRLRHELERSWSEPDVLRQLAATERLGLLSAIEPGLAFKRDRLRQTLELADRWVAEGLVAPPPRWLLCLLALLPGRDTTDVARRVDRRLRPNRSVSAALLACAEELARGPWRSGPPSSIAVRLDGLPEPVLVALAGRWPARTEEVGAYLRDWRQVKPRLSGTELEALGVPRGPALGELLRRLREARLDGRTGTKADERAVVQSWLGQEADDGS